MKDYNFNGSISLEVLNNYLDRAVSYCMFPGTGRQFDSDFIDEGIRFVTSVGAKYVHRAAGEWYPSIAIEKDFEKTKAKIDLAHSIDPDIIFEACIFETVTSAVNEIPIPEWVFEAFGLTPENRNFNVDNMCFKDGYGVKYWDNGNAHIPDITRTEFQMFVYHRACRYIDIGFESLHLGQVLLTGKLEPDNKSWAKIIGMIREYAKKNSRRGYVLINAHNNEFTAPDGSMLVDMIVAPIRPAPADDEVDHEVSEDNPQRCVLKPNYWKSAYQSGISGTSPSGWYAEKYPYIVEFDNYGGKVGDTSSKNSYVWGLDEISWFVSQPKWYRHEFMRYAIDKIRSFQENGHVAFVGFRGNPYNSMLGKNMRYFANSSKFCELGQDDEETIKALFSE